MVEIWFVIAFAMLATYIVATASTSEPGRCT